MGALEQFKLDGRAALVTGGGTGIGLGIARGLAEAGASVAVCGRTAATLDAAVEQIEALGARGLAVVADVTEPEDLTLAVERVVGAWGRLDIGVNNAGVNEWVDALEIDASGWDQVLDTNLKGVFLSCQAEAQAMIAGGGGSIVNVASMSAQIVNRPQPQAHYNASKAAVVQLTRSLAVEWAPHGIRVNSVSPGYTRTEMADAPHTRAAWPIWLRDTPLGRMAEVDDIQGAVIFLASDASGFVTGHDLVVDGGFTAL